VTIGKPLLVAIEYCELGSLKSYLGNEANAPTPLQQTLFGYDCARGLEYIHSFGFVHRYEAQRGSRLPGALLKLRRG
jgi:serine/threonine protein kinase